MLNLEASLRAYKKFGSKLGLERIKKLCDRFGNPEKKLNLIHVAGTNGKGSTCYFLSSILLAAGYSTGIFVSPAIYDFRETIQVNGAYADEEKLEAVATDVMAEAEKMSEENPEDPPTEYELLTAIALIFFEKQELDFVILETGLGGRFDSTNVIERPLATAITSISIDHVKELGGTEEKIAYEKAGIIKRSAPVVSNVRGQAAKKMIAKIAYEKSAPFADISEKKLRLPGVENLTKDFNLPLYQLKNIKTAVYVLDALRRNGALSFTQEALVSGVRGAKIPGRFEFVGSKDGAEIILDGTHNEGGAKALADSVAAVAKGKKVLLVLSILKDKDVKKILTEFGKFASGVIVTEAKNVRVTPAGELAEMVSEAYGKSVLRGVEREPKEAMKAALSMAVDYDFILGTGSFYLLKDLKSSLSMVY